MISCKKKVLLIKLGVPDAVLIKYAALLPFFNDSQYIPERHFATDDIYNKYD